MIHGNKIGLTAAESICFEFVNGSNDPRCIRVDFSRRFSDIRPDLRRGMDIKVHANNNDDGNCTRSVGITTNTESRTRKRERRSDPLVLSSPKRDQKREYGFHPISSAVVTMTSRTRRRSVFHAVITFAAWYLDIRTGRHQRVRALIPSSAVTNRFKNTLP